MDTSKLIMIAGGGLVLYYVLNKNNVAAAVTPTPAPAGNQPGNVSTTPPAPTPPANAYNTLAAIYQRLGAAAAAGGVDVNKGVGPDAWNYYLGKVSSVVPPDPATVFPNVDRSAPMTIAQYWSAMSAFLAKSAGMSGVDYMNSYPRSRFFHGGGWHA